MRGKSVLLLVLFLITILFSGCITLEIEQEVKEDGSSDVQITYDFSALMGQMDAMTSGLGGEENNTESESLSCEEFKNVTEKTGFECVSAENGVIVFNGNWQSNEQYFKVDKKLTKVIYEYDAIEVFEILNVISEGDQKIEKDTLSQMKMLNPTLEYVLIMPAEIESVEVGDVQGNKVTIDIFDLEDLDVAKIVAVKTNSMLYYIVGGVFCVILLLGLVIVISKRNKKKLQNVSVNQESQEISGEELTSKNYILRYKMQFPKESIREGLISAGVDSQKVDEYLNKYF